MRQESAISAFLTLFGWLALAAGIIGGITHLVTAFDLLGCDAPNMQLVCTTGELPGPHFWAALYFVVAGFGSALVALWMAAMLEAVLCLSAPRKDGRGNP